VPGETSDSGHAKAPVPTIGIGASFFVKKCISALSSILSFGEFPHFFYPRPAD